MIRINLIKTEKKAPPPEAIEKEKKAVPTTYIIVLFIVAAAVLFFWQSSAIRKQRNILEGWQLEKAKLKDVEAKLEQVKNNKELILKKIDLINQLKSKQGVSVTIMDELSKNIPYWVWLTEVNFNKKRLEIKGRATSNDLIADYIYNLETSPYFTNVNLNSSTQKSLRGNQYLEFSLTAWYVLQETPESSSEEDTKKEKK